MITKEEYENLKKARNIINNICNYTDADRLKRNPEFIEVKSKRVQLLLQPSTVRDVKRLAKKKKISMNELINIAIKEYLEKGRI